MRVTWDESLYLQNMATSRKSESTPENKTDRKNVCNSKFYTKLKYSNKTTCILKRPCVQRNEGYPHELCSFKAYRSRDAPTV